MWRGKLFPPLVLDPVESITRWIWPQGWGYIVCITSEEVLACYCHAIKHQFETVQEKLNNNEALAMLGILCYGILAHPAIKQQLQNYTYIKGPGMLKLQP